MVLRMGVRLARFRVPLKVSFREIRMSSTKSPYAAGWLDSRPVNPNVRVAALLCGLCQSTDLSCHASVR